MDIAHYAEWSSRLLVALLSGALIGFERQVRGKAAGLKTIIMICVGSCLFMIVSEIVGTSQMLKGNVQYVSDPGRIAAQVVTGIGFLGAGVIMLTKEKISGLTTASVVWVTAGIGMVIGLGFLLYGVMVSVFVVVVLVSINFFEKNLLSKWFEKRNSNN